MLTEFYYVSQKCCYIKKYVTKLLLFIVSYIAVLYLRLYLGFTV